MTNLTAMATFVAVARAGSFATAARRLGHSTTAVSRHVAELERTLGVTLLRRTTRSVTPTEAGARYLPQAAAILEEIDRLNAETAAQDRRPRGPLRITAPPGIGRDLIVPLVIDFIATYSEIDLELSLTERMVDLVAEGFDAAIRSGPLASSNLIAHRIVTLHYRLCASPDYLRERGMPSDPQELTRHDCLHWRGDDPSSTATAWHFVRNGETTEVPIRRRLLVSDLAALREASIRGLGLASLPEVGLQADLGAGRLVQVLPEYEMPSSTLSLVRPPTRFEPAKLRVFIDFITSALRQRANESARR